MNNEVTNQNAVNTFMKSVEEKYPDLIAKIEDTILENASNLKTINGFNVHLDNLDRDEQIELLSVVSKYFKHKGFDVSNIIYGESLEEAPYITIEINISSK